MNLLSESFQVSKIEVFNQRVHDFSTAKITASHEKNKKIFSSFISNLRADDFSTQLSEPKCSKIQPSDQLPNTLSPDDYLLICSCEDDRGYHYQVLEPVFLEPVAYCIVQKDLMTPPINPSLVDELKTCLINSSQDGYVYHIMIPGLMSEADNASYELIKNVNFLGKALNIVTLDPINLVNSFSSTNALDYSFTEATAILSSDARYGIPPGTKLEPRFTTSVNIDSSIFEEKTSFSNTFATTVSLNIPIPPALMETETLVSNAPPKGGEAAANKAAAASAFSASFSYEFVKENTKESKNVVTYTTATRSLYILKQDISYDPKLMRLDSEFRYWIEQKLDPSNPANLEQFITTVGTHYTNSVTYGGVGFQVLTITAATVTELNEKKISISAAAANALLSSSASSDSKNTYFSFESQTSSKTAFLGGTILPEADANHKLVLKDWAGSVSQEPIPLQIKVSLLTDLLTPALFPNMDIDKLNNLKSALLNAITEYLNAHTPKEIPAKQVFTTNYYDTDNRFFLETTNAPKIISNPYEEEWSLQPYLFPTLKETSGADPLRLFFCLDQLGIQQKIVHNSSYYLCSSAIYEGVFTAYFQGTNRLSFSGSWPQAYFDYPYTSSGFWTVEKINTTQDLFIRDGDQIRLKHLGSSEYLATTAMKDGKQTLTRTKDQSDAIFTIRKASNTG